MVNQMGHYLSEMDPAGTDARHTYADRVYKLRNRLESLSMSHFTIGNLGALNRVMGINLAPDPSEKDLQQLERRVRGIKRKKQRSSS